MSPKNPWKIYRTRFLVRARQLTEPLTFIDSFGREHSGQVGDYLVEFSDGIRRITTQALFEDIYVPLAPMQISSVGISAGAVSPDSTAAASSPSAISKPVAPARHATCGSGENRFQATA